MLRALKREGESGKKRERKGRAFFFFFFFSRRRRRRFASNSNRARARFDRFLCSPKDDAFVLFLFFFGVLFDDVDQ